MTKINSKYLLAERIWNRYRSGLDKGHVQYQEEALKNERYYLGGGRQWDSEYKELLEATGRPTLEPNMIFSIVNTVLGYQTQSRMSIAYVPRDMGDDEGAELMTKVAMYIMDKNKYSWSESDMFADGVIRQRGYMDIRLDFDDNMFGNISMEVIDPLNVIPDPDADKYDPDDWNDVMIAKWLTLEEIEEVYGRAKRIAVEKTHPDEPNFGTEGVEQERTSFGKENAYNRWILDEEGLPRVRVLERQYWKLRKSQFFVDIETGDLEAIQDGLTKREIDAITRATGKEVIEKVTKRVRWTVTTSEIILHDEWSPYKHFTVVPYFPYFRRGQTVGMIDNLISTQDMLNKTFSQMLHVINTTANSGWIIQENSLSNMDVEDLDDVGAQSGLVLEYKRGHDKPEKIQPNQIPSGLDGMVVRGMDFMKTISGIHEAFSGGKGPEVSGAAIQTRVQQNALQLAAPIDNLFKTRNLIAIRLLDLIQEYYTEPRTLLITKDESEENAPQPVDINQEQEDGSIINDLSMGKYDIVIADVPTNITFKNSQFAEAIELRKFGVEIPDDVIVKYSNLADKEALSKRLSGQADPEAEQMQKQQMQIQIETLQAELDKTKSEGKSKEISAIESAVTVAQALTLQPEIAPIVDQLMQEDEEQPAPAPEEQLPIQPEQAQLGV